MKENLKDANIQRTGAELPLIQLACLEQYGPGMIGEDEIRVCHCSQETAKLGTVFRSCSARQFVGFPPPIAQSVYKPPLRDTRGQKRYKWWKQSTVDLQSKRKMSF